MRADYQGKVPARGGGTVSESGEVSAYVDKGSPRVCAWQNMAELHAVYGSADVVHVRSGRPVIVFNVCGNTYRLVVAIHFNRQMAYMLRFLTHAEYDRNQWKERL